MKRLASPAFALGFGSFLALAETVRRWGNWPFLPFLLSVKRILAGLGPESRVGWVLWGS